MSSLHISDLLKRKSKFTVWLVAAGAEVLKPTNPYEVLRFRANGITSIVYQNDAGSIKMTGESEVAWNAYRKPTAHQWTAVKTKRARVSPAIRTIRARDGDLCFFCGWQVLDHEASVDHLVPLANNGPNHIGNYVLMHMLCNQQCGHMSATEKIRAHVEWQILKVNP